MKKLVLSLIVGVMATFGQAHADFSQLAQAIMIADAQNAVHTQNVINWKVGEFAEYDMSAAFGSMGTMSKKATAEEGNGIWVKSEVTGMASQTQEMLFDRADGHILKYRQNGQDAKIPDDKIEIISQDTATITVPAGTFESIHIVAKSEQAKNIELWANPRDVTLDGGIQMIVDAGFLTITMKLTKFGGK